MRIGVLLADDQNLVREGLCALLRAAKDFDIVGEAENGRRAVQLAAELSPDVVLMDLEMPLLNGLEATRQITHQTPSAKVLIMSSYSDDEYVGQAIAAGAMGFVAKLATAAELHRAIREAHEGNSYFSPAVLERLRNRYRRALQTHEPEKYALDQLTSRELEVLQLIAEGKANKEIATELSISVKTVEKHRQQLMNKLNIHEIAGLTRYAISKGIIGNLAPHPSGIPSRISGSTPAADKE